MNTTKKGCCEKCSGFREKPGASMPPCATVMDCECHVSKKDEGWETRFDVHYFDGEFGDFYDENGDRVSLKAIKAFMAAELDKQREELAREVEGLKKDVRPEIEVWLTNWGRKECEAYNSALSDALAIIRGEK